MTNELDFIERNGKFDVRELLNFDFGECNNSVATTCNIPVEVVDEVISGMKNINLLMPEELPENIILFISRKEKSIRLGVTIPKGQSDYSHFSLELENNSSVKDAYVINKAYKDSKIARKYDHSGLSVKNRYVGGDEGVLASIIWIGINNYGMRFDSTR